MVDPPDPLRGVEFSSLSGPKIFQPKTTENFEFELPGAMTPGAIMYTEEIFLCKNAIKVKFTLCIFDPLETP